MRPWTGRAIPLRTLYRKAEGHFFMHKGPAQRKEASIDPMLKRQLEFEGIISDLEAVQRCSEWAQLLDH